MIINIIIDIYILLVNNIWGVFNIIKNLPVYCILYIIYLYPVQHIGTFYTNIKKGFVINA